MKQLNFGTFKAQGIKKKRHNDRSHSLILDNILSDIKNKNIDAIGTLVITGIIIQVQDRQGTLNAN